MLVPPDFFVKKQPAALDAGGVHSPGLPIYIHFDTFVIRILLRTGAVPLKAITGTGLHGQGDIRVIYRYEGKTCCNTLRIVDNNAVAG